MVLVSGVPACPSLALSLQQPHVARQQAQQRSPYPVQQLGQFQGEPLPPNLELPPPQGSPLGMSQSCQTLPCACWGVQETQDGIYRVWEWALEGTSSTEVCPSFPCTVQNTAPHWGRKRQPELAVTRSASVSTPLSL